MNEINIKKLETFVQEKLKIPELVNQLTDSRKKYEISLSQIFFLPFYSYILGKNNLLSIDQFSREHFVKTFLQSDREMVASDSTLQRNIGHNIQKEEISSINMKIMNNENVKLHLNNPVLNKRCGILDGTGLSKFLKEVLFIPGTVDFIFNFNSIVKKGKELVSAQNLIKSIGLSFGKNFFDLLLFDGLYYSGKIFTLCENYLDAKCLVKTSERLNVVKDVEGLISNNNEAVINVSGFDEERMCSYSIKAFNNIEADTIKSKLQVAVIEEKYIKTNKIETFYVITNDLSLTPKHLRYAAHTRWRIENNGFKMLNHLFETKRKISKDEKFITNLLWIIFIAYNTLMLFLNMFELKKIAGSVKITMKLWTMKLYHSLVIYYSINQNDSS